MNPEAREVLDKILQKNIAELTKEEIGFLQARRIYLTKKQKETLKEVLNKVLKPEKPQPDPNHIPYKELQRKAKSLGYPYVGIKREDLECCIATAEGPEYYKK